jgi:hypothetical protein
LIAFVAFLPSQNVFLSYAEGVARTFSMAPSLVPSHKNLGYDIRIHDFLDLEVVEEKEKEGRKKKEVRR